MLRHRSGGVARYSQHMLGHAMDFYIPGVPLEQLREYRPAAAARRRRLLSGIRLALRAYGHRRHPHVAAHDARAIGARLPRRPHRLIPTDGKPLPGYALALADIRKARQYAVGRIRSRRRAPPASMSVRWWRATNARRQIPSPSFWAWRRTRMRKTIHRARRRLAAAAAAQPPRNTPSSPRSSTAPGPPKRRPRRPRSRSRTRRRR